jgi:hypothetical protein
MKVLFATRDYEGAEDSAYRYKGDTRTSEPVRVVEDFDAAKGSTSRFLVVLGGRGRDDGSHSAGLVRGMAAALRSSVHSLIART